MLLSSDELSEQLKPAFYLLVGFSLELCLKSLCLAGGMPESDLRPLGHDLVEALNAAIKFKQLPSYYTDTYQLIELIGPMHRDLSFRYTRANTPVLNVPTPAWCIGPLKSLAVLADKAASSSDKPAAESGR